MTTTRQRARGAGGSPMTLALLRSVAPVGLAAVVVGAAVAGAFGFWLVGSVVAAVVVALAAWRTVDGATARVGATVAGRDLGPDAAPRLHNLLEAACLRAGVPRPAVRVITDDAMNSIVVGRARDDAVMVVTSGLLDGLARIEMEGVVARQVALIGHPATAAATVAAAFAGWMPGPLAVWTRTLTGRPDFIAAADVAAVDLTRYPPGLAAALEKVAAGPRGPAQASECPPAIVGLWLQSPDATTGGGRSTIDLRIETLREL